MDGDANGTDIVDMGADEFYWSPADFDRNGIVNFLDYAVLAAAWLTDNPNISLDNDNDVDMYDLALFCKDWLWQPGQEQSDPLGMMGFGYGQGMTQSLGFTDVLYQAEQPQLVFEPQPVVSLSNPPQPEVQSESEPQSQYEPYHTTQELIDWLEGVLADEQNRDMIDEDGIRLMIESLKEQL
jgi:hypothetical protein